MARKRKKTTRLNKRVVIVLAVLGFAVVVAIGLSSQTIRDWLFPPDTAALAAEAGELVKEARALVVEADKLVEDAGELTAEAKGKYEQAHKAYGQADKNYQIAIYHSGKTPVEKAEYCYRHGKMLLEQFWVKGNAISQTIRGELLGRGLKALDESLRQDPDRIDSQRLKCQTHWRLCEIRRNRNQPVRPANYIDEAGRLLAMDEKDHQTWYRRGVLRALQADIDGAKAGEALKDMQRAIDLKPDEVDYSLAKARFEVEIGRVDGAENTYKAAMEAEGNANNSTLRVAYAGFLLKHDRSKEARAQIDEAVKRAPGDTVGLYALAQFLTRQERKPAEALAVLERARKIDPEDYRIYSELANTHQMLNNLPEAIKVLRLGIEKIAQSTKGPTTSPAEELRRLIRRGARAQLNYALAKAILSAAQKVPEKEKRQTMLDEARACATIVRETGGSPPFYNCINGLVAYYEGKNIEARGLLESAYKAFGRRLDPAVAWTLMELYDQTGVPGKAEAIIDRFLRTSEYLRSVPLRLRKAGLLMRYGRWSEAELLVREALRIDGSSKGAKELLAVIGFRSGRIERLEADVELTKAVVTAIMFRATSLWSDGQRQQGIELLEGLLARAPDNGTVARQLIAMYRSDKKTRKLEDLLAKIKSAQPELAAQIQYGRELLDEKDPQKRLAMQVERAGKIKDALQRELTLADLYRSAGQKGKSVAHLDKAALLKPDSPAVLHKRFSYAVQAENWTLAQQVVDQAAKANIDNANGKLFAARLAASRGRSDVAIRTYTEILDADGNNMFARIERGQAYVRLGKLDEAAGDFRAVADGDPGNAVAAISMMLVFERQGKRGQYDEWLDRAHRLSPRHPDVLRRFTDRGAARAASIGEIIAKRRKQLIADPNDLNNRLKLGNLYERTGKIAEAEEMFVSVRKLASDKVVGTRALAMFYVRTNRLGMADDTIQNLLETTDNKVGGYILYGEILASRKPDQARRAFDNAIKADPENPAGHYALARFHAASGAWDPAVKAMTQCVRLSKNAPAYEGDLILYQIRGRKFADAQARLDRILKASPTAPVFLRHKARLVLDRDNDIASAEDLLSTAVRENVNDIASLTTRAQFYVGTRNLDKARADYEKARQIADTVDTSLPLSDVYRGLKLYRQAESILTDLLKRVPDRAPVIIERLAGLYTVQKKYPALEALLARACKAQRSNWRYRILASQMWSRRGQQDKALSALADAVGIAPKSLTTIVTYVDALLGAEQYAKVLEVTGPYVDNKNFAPTIPAMRARALVKSGKVAEGQAILRDLVKTSPARSLGFLAGQLLATFGADKTIAHLADWRGRTDEWEYHQVLADLHRQAKRTDKAVAELVKARDLVPAGSPVAGRINRQLGIDYYQQGRIPEAQKAYLAALAVLPNDPGLLNNIAFMYADDLDNPREALPYATKAYRWASKNANVADTYAWVLAKLTRYKEAETILAALVQQENVVPAARYHLGWIYERQGRHDEAIKQYRYGQTMITDKTRNEKLYDMFVASIKRVQGKQNR